MKLIITVTIPEAELAQVLKDNNLTREEFKQEISTESAILDPRGICEGATASMQIED